ncbi:MAG: cell division protein FtsZ [Bacteroidaceae bacterium]|nr:cell division protein FtsZ [Bacteroidaceae bacterium]MBR7052796.1 cell division protein FtsZ [Bacteroidaceae bacterium]MCR5140327.1 cell division protein FtsZ [Bacteroidaceae bacterium]
MMLNAEKPTIMDTNNDFGMGIQFEMPKNNPSIIKVIGVGGGGGNAVNHMFREGIHDVSYVVCNTDQKALEESPVPTRVQLGDGLGAGNKPDVGREKAIESIEQIKQMFTDGTRMVFVTAGMGGGTGTGAAPIIAQCAKDMDILTVGIVTIPFLFEGKMKIFQALEGVQEISKHVDALLVINNERLREIYQDLTVINAFKKADDTLSVAAKSIAEIITMRGIINMDFQDVTTVLKNGGVAIMSTGFGEGSGRVTKAIEEALHSPLLNNNDIYNSKKVLLNINFSSDDGKDSLMMEEINEVNDFMAKFKEDVEVKWGLATDPTLGNKVKITLLASGFGLQGITGITVHDKEKAAAEAHRETERLEQLNDIMVEYYNGSGAATKRRPNIYIYDLETFDNEDVIARVDGRPTGTRTGDELRNIKELVKDVSEDGETL